MKNPWRVRRAVVILCCKRQESNYNEKIAETALIFLPDLGSQPSHTLPTALDLPIMDKVIEASEVRLCIVTAARVPRRGRFTSIYAFKLLASQLLLAVLRRRLLDF
jgi:hypothetical protein